MSLRAFIAMLLMLGIAALTAVPGQGCVPMAGAQVCQCCHGGSAGSTAGCCSLSGAPVRENLPLPGVAVDVKQMICAVVTVLRGRSFVAGASEPVRPLVAICRHGQAVFKLNCIRLI